MTPLEEALERIEATTDMGDFGAGLLHAAGVIRDALEAEQRVLDAVLELHKGMHYCGGNWYTDGTPYQGTIARREPCPTRAAIDDVRLVLPQPDDTWEHIWIEGEPLNVVLDAGKDYVLHFTGPVPEGSSIRGGRNVVWLGSTR